MDDQQARLWDMWEEKAFAEDTFVWPPRSYSCSFCGKEFKSAQALGGHMNVHRRDRARLQKSPVKSIQNPTVELEILEYPNQVCSMIYSPNIVNHNSGELASSLSHITFPTVSFTQKSAYDQSLVLSSVQDQIKRPFYSFPPSRSDSTSDHMRLFSFLDSKIEEVLIKKQKTRPCEADIIKNEHFPSTNVNMNLQVTSSEIEETTSCKERRTDIALPFFLQAAIEDNLDLELRLGRTGDQTKV